MKSRALVTALGFCLITSALAGVRTKEEAPAWVTELASRNVPTYGGDVPAVVLLRNKNVVVDSSGLRTLTERQGTKILTRAGQGKAMVVVGGSKGAIRIRSFKAWLVSPSGWVKSYDRNNVTVIQAFDRMDLYSDVTFWQIKADNPEVGSVFVYELQAEEHPLFAQDDWAFQDSLPVVESRYSLTAPPNWNIKACLSNHPAVEPIHDGNTSSWRLTDLPFQPEEPHAPETEGLVPQIHVDLTPNTGLPSLQPGFASWADVSRWQTTLASGQDEATPFLVTKAQQLGGPSTDAYSAIASLAHYVQDIRYVAIEMNLAKGDGYKPHTADLVIHKQYGDCKDKANLLRALLKVRGIDSYLVAVYSGDRGHVQPEWPSPMQFNHMILAIKAPADAPAALPSVSVPVLGRLLIFDPTSESTPLGDLPWYEQGSYACLIAGENGRLIQLPVLAAEANSTDVTVKAKLDADGLLEADCTITGHGSDADQIRSRQFYLGSEENHRYWERFFSGRTRNGSLATIDSTDQWNDNNLVLHAKLTAHDFAQHMQDRLLVFSLAILEPESPTFPMNSHRKEPIVLRGRTYRKHVAIKLPQGWTADEMPQDVERTVAWGKFSLHFASQAGELIMDELLVTEAQTVAPEKYKAVKQFFDTFNGADTQQVVVARN